MRAPPQPRCLKRHDSAVQIQLPSVVEVEVNSRCNRRCGYCPVSILPPPSAPRYMEDPVFESLMKGLAGFGFDGRLSYHFYNEPLLRRDLERLVSWAAEMLPTAHQVLYTNGDLLTNDRYRSLVDAGISEFIVTRHDGDAYVDRPNQVVLVPAQLRLTNRGGTLFVPGHALTLPCYAPSEMLIVTVDGDVLLCYEDAKRQNLMGNVTREPLLAIWGSERFVKLRQRLGRGEREGVGGICAECNNQAHDLPGTSWFAL